VKALLQTRAVLATALLVAGLGEAAWTQDSPNPNSLGDLARQTRSQKQSAGGNNKAQELVDQMEQEQEASENAPPGFKTYNAGDYRLWVPFPYELEGRDNRGTVLAGSRLGVTNTEVMAGNPVPIPANLSDGDLYNVIRALGQQYAGSPGCSPIKAGERQAYRCTLANISLLNHAVWGTMAFVVGSNSVVPVMCVSPDEMNEHLVYGNPKSTYQQKQAAFAHQAQRFRDATTTLQVCDQIVYPSIRLKEDYLSPALASVNSGKAKPATEAKTTLGAVPGAAVAAPQSVTADNGLPSGGVPSLAELARQKKQASTQTPKAKVAVDSTGDSGLAPPGFKPQSFYYCKGMGVCWNGSAFVPMNAQLLNSDFSQYVFEVSLGGDKLLLYLGPAAINGQGRMSTDPNLVRWGEMSDPEGWVARGRVQAVTHDEATVDGKPAILTHFELKKHDLIWAGRRAMVTNHEVEVLAGCMTPKNRFADADEICSVLIDSVRLP
jgi:hypothetical protein